MKKCLDCDFWFNPNCKGLMRDARVEIVVAGGYSAPDDILTTSDFGCLAHSGYVAGQVRYVHPDCGGSFSKKEVDSFIGVEGSSSFKICPKCGKWIEVSFLEIVIGA